MSACIVSVHIHCPSSLNPKEPRSFREWQLNNWHPGATIPGTNRRTIFGGFTKFVKPVILLLHPPPFIVKFQDGSLATYTSQQGPVIEVLAPHISAIQIFIIPLYQQHLWYDRNTESWLSRAPVPLLQRRTGWRSVMSIFYFPKPFTKRPLPFIGMKVDEWPWTITAHLIGAVEPPIWKIYAQVRWDCHPIVRLVYVGINVEQKTKCSKQFQTNKQIQSTGWLWFKFHCILQSIYDYYYHKNKTSPLPIGSMYAIYGDIYINIITPNLGIYTIHGSYGLYPTSHFFVDRFPTVRSILAVEPTDSLVSFRISTDALHCELLRHVSWRNRWDRRIGCLKLPWSWWRFMGCIVIFFVEGLNPCSILLRYGSFLMVCRCMSEWFIEFWEYLSCLFP